MAGKAAGRRFFRTWSVLFCSDVECGFLPSSGGSALDVSNSLPARFETAFGCLCLRQAKPERHSSQMPVGAALDPSRIEFHEACTIPMSRWLGLRCILFFINRLMNAQ